MRMVAGRRYYGEDVNASAIKETRKFREILEEFMECTEITHLGDLIPILKWLIVMPSL